MIHALSRLHGAADIGPRSYYMIRRKTYGLSHQTTKRLTHLLYQICSGIVKSGKSGSWLGNYSEKAT